MGGVCNTCEGPGEVHTGFRWGNPRERDRLENPGVNGRLILRRIFRKLDGGMGWIDLAQDSDRWRAVVNAGMKFGFPKIECGEFLD